MKQFSLFLFLHKLNKMEQMLYLQVFVLYQSPTPCHILLGCRLKKKQQPNNKKTPNKSNGKGVSNKYFIELSTTVHKVGSCI